MIKSESRKSNLFTALKSRKSLKDLSARVQKTTSLISGPFVQTQSDSHSMHSANNRAAKPLSPIDVNSAPNKRLSKVYFTGEGQENASRRHSLAWKKRSSSPASELTLATISAMPSDLASVDSHSIDLPSPTILEHEGKTETQAQINARHLQYTQYADLLDIDEPCTPTRIHRTTNIGDIRRFLESDDMLPMNNRKSLEFEAHEIQMLCSRLCTQEKRDCAVKFVENAFVMTFFDDTYEEQRYWDVIDANDAVKGDLDSALYDHTLF
ncbi:hypothetical protein OXX80_006201 [Metschnikowia pulcherrima]